MKKTLLLSILVLLPGVTLAQEQTDLTRYNTSVSFALESNELKVLTELTIPVSALTNNKAQLFLNKSFDIDDIAGESLKEYSVSPSKKVPPWNEVTLSFESVSKVHEVTVSYRGEIDEAAGHGNFIASKGIHLSIDSAWHPFYKNFATPMQGELEVILPQKWKVYGPGSVSMQNNAHQMSVTKDRIDVSFYASPNGNEYTDGNFTVVYDKANKDRAKRLATAGNNCLAALNGKFGQTEELESASLVILERAGPSFARGSYLSVSSQGGRSKQQSYHYICHELAHNWTSLGNAMSHDYWMMESFAEYVAAEEVKLNFGTEAYEKVLAAWKSRAKKQSFVWRADIEQRASSKVNYGLGPLKLKQLKAQIGEEKFARLLHWYMTEQVTETEQLLKHLKELTSDEDALWFRLLLEGRKTDSA
ncbi:M1 family aminopeptidase [Idiomarina ramblicola]|uniref:Peptidase M1 membrane alanine aminopeptidase domain-containing protein n=1 Tax=Idiomarina ramblicola TaxID=263724 RepID=A0A432Z5M8_9GAMM|nr:M1 family aminopeptidase [Idiomarina ramblicola]RUO73187.1 hypothetical protein CWI78_01730 [Idiomarina ramblicola]